MLRVLRHRRSIARALPIASVLVLASAVAAQEAEPSPALEGGVFEPIPRGGTSAGARRTFFSDGRFEERYGAPESCRPYLAEREGTWVRQTTAEGDVIVVTWSRATRVTGGTAITSEITGCSYRDERRETRSERSTVRWAITACAPEERTGAAPCLRMANRPWARIAAVAEDGASSDR